MKTIITNNQHEYKVGRFHIQVDFHDVTVWDREDGSRFVMSETMTIDEQLIFAQALYIGAKIRQKSQELLEDELLFDVKNELEDYANSL